MHRPVAAAVDDELIHYPDEEQVPEARAHRSMAVLLKVAVARTLGADWAVDGNLNWYPDDGGTPVAPDVIVLPAGLLAPDATSYQQRDHDGPAPRVVVEIPSRSDDFPTFVGKLHRLQRLGTVVYVVNVAPAEPEVFRLGPGDDALRAWLGQACPELGGIVFQVRDRQLVVWMPDGLVAADVEELNRVLETRATNLEQEREALRDRLRAAGLDT